MAPTPYLATTFQRSWSPKGPWPTFVLAVQRLFGYTNNAFALQTLEISAASKNMTPSTARPTTIDTAPATPTLRARKTPLSANRRVEVIVEQKDDGRREVLVQDLSFGAGVGWYVQKTMRLDPEQVEALLKSLCVARCECPAKAEWVQPNAKKQGGRIVNFPRGED